MSSEKGSAYPLQDVSFQKDPFFQYTDDQQGQAIVIDNGGHTCSVGWCAEPQPRMQFRNLIARSRTKKEENPISLIGNDIEDLENSKWQIKTQFDVDVVSHFDAQEEIFDYIFSHLGLTYEQNINHPIVMTEAVCIPNHFRKNMSEVLFECYNVPQVMFGIDSMFSLYHNKKRIEDGLVISSGYQTTHVMPIVNGRFDAVNCRRINLGGMNHMAYMQRLLQLKYPQHSQSITLSCAQEMVQQYTYMAPHYMDELKRWSDSKYASSNRIKVQLPVINTLATDAKERELRKQQAIRLKEVNQRKREEKLKAEEERLQKLIDLDKLEMYNPKVYKIRMKQEGLKTSEDIEKEISALKEIIQARKQKIADFLSEQERNFDTDFKVDVNGKSVDPTDGMTPEEINVFLGSLRKQKQDILEKQRGREARRNDLKKRKSYASKERMRILSQLAKSGGASKKQKEDTFGMNDDDWDVYKYIKKDGSDSEDDNDQEKLNDIDNLLLQCDPMKKPLAPGMNLDSLAVHYQVDLAVERIRIPEAIYQPSLLGIEQGGLAETIHYVLKLYDCNTQQRLVKNVFVTGGNTKYSGFKERLHSEMMCILPFQSTFDICMAHDPLLDSWHGACDFFQDSSDFSSLCVSRSEYDEFGGAYIKEHFASNPYIDIIDNV